MQTFAERGQSTPLSQNDNTLNSINYTLAAYLRVQFIKLDSQNDQGLFKSWSLIVSYDWLAAAELLPAPLHVSA